ncbi:MAG: FHA domain-containing protein, partial [Armatimonadetes bacterium]|nr:FHA domain-containing protein [Armatimonadota bacterium]
LPTDPTNLSDQPIAIARLRSASDERADIAVGPGLASIGRRTGNTYSIPDDPFVSGRHAEISADDEGVRICDVGSTNGTTVNGQRIQPNEPVTLMDGDEVGIGQGRYVFEALAPAPDPDRDADDEWFDVELFDDMAVTDSDTDGSNRSEETP